MTPHDALDALIGTMPDRVVAELFDMSHSAVACLRTKQGIAPYRRHVRTTQEKLTRRETYNALGLEYLPREI